MNDTVKACITCRYCKPRSGLPEACLIRGGSCSSERTYSDLCGPSGKMWEPIPERYPGIVTKVFRFILGYQPR